MLCFRALYPSLSYFLIKLLSINFQFPTHFTLMCFSSFILSLHFVTRIAFYFYLYVLERLERCVCNVHIFKFTFIFLKNNFMKNRICDISSWICDLSPWIYSEKFAYMYYCFSRTKTNQCIISTTLLWSHICICPKQTPLTKKQLNAIFSEKKCD